MKRARKNGEEQDAFDKVWKRYLIWRPGERKRIKQRANRRERREARRGLSADLVIYDEVAEFFNLADVDLEPWQTDMLKRVYRGDEWQADLQS